MPKLNGPESEPLVSVFMGSASDGNVAQEAENVLNSFGVPYELRVVSAHRTPEKMIDHAKGLSARGILVGIAIAGGSAHLPGMSAAVATGELWTPILAVPVKKPHHGDEARLSSIALPPGTEIPVFPNNAGAGAARFAVGLLSMVRHELDLIPQMDADHRVRVTEVEEYDALARTGEYPGAELAALYAKNRTT